MRSRMCDSGSSARHVSSSLTRNVYTPARTLEQMLCWANITPLGGPFVPDLYPRGAPHAAAGAPGPPKAERQPLHPAGRVLARNVAPRAIRLGAERGRMRPIGLHRVEEQLGQSTGGGAHGRNLTTKVAGEPGTV